MPLCRKGGHAFPPDKPLRGVTFSPFAQVEPPTFHYRKPVSRRAPPELLP